MDSRVNPRDAFIGSKVRSIILTHSTLNSASNLCSYISRSLVGRTHVLLPWRTFLSSDTLDTLRDGLEGVLHGIILGGVCTGRHGCGEFAR